MWAPRECWQLRGSEPGQKRGPRRGRGARVANRGEAGARLSAQRTVLDSNTGGKVQQDICGWMAAQRASGRGPERARLGEGPGGARHGSGKRPMAGSEPSATRAPRPAGPRPQPSPSRPCPKPPHNLLPRPLPEAVLGAESGCLARSECVSFVCQARGPCPAAHSGCAQPPAPPGKRVPGSRNADRNATLAANSCPASAAMAAATLAPDAAVRSPTILPGTASRGFPSGPRPWGPPPPDTPTPARARTPCATRDAAAKWVGGAGGEPGTVTRGNPAV